AAQGGEGGGQRDGQAVGRRVPEVLLAEQAERLRLVRVDPLGGAPEGAGVRLERWAVLLRVLGGGGHRDVRRLAQLRHVTGRVPNEDLTGALPLERLRQRRREEEGVDPARLERRGQGGNPAHLDQVGIPVRVQARADEEVTGEDVGGRAGPGDADRQPFERR